MLDRLGRPVAVHSRVSALLFIHTAFLPRRLGQYLRGSSASSILEGDRVLLDTFDGVQPNVAWMGSTGRGSWLPLGDHVVADEEGDHLFKVNGNLEFCKTICNNYQGCRSFAYCNHVCHLKGGELNATSPSHSNKFCTTYYWSANETATTITTTTTQTPEPEPEVVCRTFTSQLAMNVLQMYDDNPEGDITGHVRLFLCTNGTMSGTLHLEEGHSEIIATHIHHCRSGSLAHSRSGATCIGDPIVNFCGNNAEGLINNGARYTGPCAGYNLTTGVSETEDMVGRLVPTLGLTAPELVAHMIEHPDMYYFNVHSLASYNQWHPEFRGIARGVIELQEIPVTTTTLPPVGPDDLKKCFTLYSRLAMSESQAYSGNADAHASGYASFLLCANGTMSATMLVFGGVSEVIATQVYRCGSGDSLRPRASETCEGAPVIVFCGENAPGYLDVGVDYPQACAEYSSLGSARTENMKGAVVPRDKGERNVAALVLDIVRNPQMYYFNVHSLDSYGHWYPEHHGMCRGPMYVW